MHGTVVKEGRVYDAPGRKGHGVIGSLRRGQTVEILNRELDGAWVQISVDEAQGSSDLHSGYTGYVRSYRLAVGGPHGVRLDRYYGYDGWSHKSDHRVTVSEDEEGPIEGDTMDSFNCASKSYVDQSYVDHTHPPTPAPHNPMGELLGAAFGAMQAAEETERAEIAARKPAVQAAILDAGQQMTLPSQDGPRGYLEPGSGMLALIDRYLLSKERRAALASVNDERGVAAQARYLFAATMVRWTVVGLAFYGAFEIARKII